MLKILALSPTLILKFAPPMNGKTFPGFLSVKFKLTDNGILNSWHLIGEHGGGE
jgi:hypothetical protein